MVEALEVLACSGCSAPLALGDGDAVTCPSCGAVTPVPPAYRDMHRARGEDVQLRVEAERLLRRVDRPPHVVTKILARVLDQPMFVFLALFGVPVGLAAIFFSIGVADRWLAPMLHVATPDDVPFGFPIAIMFASLFVIAMVPRALGVYANRRATGRARLLGALAAHPPKTPGGAASCRRCGAPLAVAPDELVAICSYCRAENAVGLETKLVVATKAMVEELGLTVRDVAARDRSDRAETLHKLGMEVRRYAIRTVLLGGGFAASGISQVATIATVVLFIYYIASSSSEDDAATRNAGNDVPAWVGTVGSIVVTGVLWAVVHWFYVTM